MTWYAVEDCDDLFTTYDDAYEYIEYTNEGASSDKLDDLCDQMIYEVDGILDLAEWCDGDEDCIFHYEPNFVAIQREMYEDKKADDDYEEWAIREHFGDE
jgi:hypothetical protein